jgi:hypothetical protein
MARRKYFDKIIDIIPPWASFSAVPNMNSGMMGSRILKKYLTNASAMFRKCEIFPQLTREQSNPKMTPARRAKSFETMGLSASENGRTNGCASQFAAAPIDATNPVFTQKFPSKYAMHVLKKLEQQISGIITRRDFTEPSTPIRYSDDDTSEKITNGIRKSMHSLMARLVLQKNDFTWIGKKSAHSIAAKNEHKKTMGIANFFIFSSFFIFSPCSELETIAKLSQS